MISEQMKLSLKI